MTYDKVALQKLIKDIPGLKAIAEASVGGSVDGFWVDVSLAELIDGMEPTDTVEARLRHDVVLELG